VRLGRLGGKQHVVMLLENAPYPEDPRVRDEATALTRAGHEVTVLAPRAPGELARETVNGVRVRRYRTPDSPGSKLGYLLEYGVAHLQLWCRAAWEVLRGATVVHLHNPPDTLFPIGLVARALGRKMVFDQHDLTPELYAQIFGRSRLFGVLRAAQHASVRTADLVVFTNESQRGAALRRNGLEPSHAVVVRNGPLRRTLDSSPARGGALKDPHLAYVGLLGWQDGVLEMPAILASLREDFGLREARLTVIGFGPCAAELESRAADHGVSEWVTFTGKVPNEEVPGLLAAADICVDPAPCNALNHHSTMVKIAEYLAAARPVVAYELRETVATAGDAALYARCGDQKHFVELVAALAERPELRARLAEAGRSRVPGLVWERSEKALVEAYESL
jgi:glycosyltransferase involved in cell wall biosynthesis